MTDGLTDGARQDRRRFSKWGLYLIVAGGLFVLLRTWHGRSIEAELVHRFPSGDVHLPAEIEIQVWQGDVLQADAYFPNPDSLAELTHTIRVPPGTYRVTFSILRPFPEVELRYQRDVSIEGEGRYFLSYE